MHETLVRPQAFRVAHQQAEVQHEDNHCQPAEDGCRDKVAVLIDVCRHNAYPHK